MGADLIIEIEQAKYTVETVRIIAFILMTPFGITVKDYFIGTPVGSGIVILYFLALFVYGVDMLVKSCDTIGKIKLRSGA